AAHRVVAVAVAEVHQDLLRVGAADPGEDRPRHHPVGAQGPGVGDLLERDRRHREPARELVRFGGRSETLRRDAEHECSHGDSSWRARRAGYSGYIWRIWHTLSSA